MVIDTHHMVNVSILPWSKTKKQTDGYQMIASACFLLFMLNQHVHGDVLFFLWMIEGVNSCSMIYFVHMLNVYPLPFIDDICHDR